MGDTGTEEVPWRLSGWSFRAELRRRWRSWLAVALLVSLVGGFVLAATDAGRRTDSAFPGFLAVHGIDAVGYASQPVPKLATLPEVASAVRILAPANGQATCSCGHFPSAADLGVVAVPAAGTGGVFEACFGPLA